MTTLEHLFPRLSMPFPVKVNPHIDIVDEEALQRTADSGMASDEGFPGSL
ncbi:hypothetical protein [Streptomyces sp. NPDC002537]